VRKKKYNFVNTANIRLNLAPLERENNYDKILYRIFFLLVVLVFC
jgi:hypothetical protein